VKIILEIIQERQILSRSNWSRELDQVEEEHHTIISLYKQKHGELIKAMKNDILQRKDPFLNSISKIRGVLERWWTHYCNKTKWFSEANDRVTFTLTSE